MIWLLVLTSVVTAQDYEDQCPETDGFYSDAIQCDRYYECKGGELTEHLCPDGLVFDETSIQFAKCSFPFSIDCGDRKDLQPPQPTDLCPRKNGYFPHENANVCDKFYFCVDGVANLITCPASLIFDPSKGQCAYSDQVSREGCSSENIFKFSCPDTSNAPHEHPRYPDPQDCQYFYICIGGTSPRRNGCTNGLVFNKEKLACDRPDNVNDECKTWYNETFLESIKVTRRPSQGTPVNLTGRKRVKVRKQRPLSSRPTASTRPANTPDERLVSDSVEQKPSSPIINNQRVRTKTRVRTRVTTRPPPSQDSFQETQDVPPSFSLSDEDSISRFRQQHRVNGGGNSRLAILDLPKTRLQQQPEEFLPSQQQGNFGGRVPFRQRAPINSE